MKILRIKINGRNTPVTLPTRIIIYFCVMLIGVMLRTYITHTITIVWIVNLTGLIGLFMPYFRYYERGIALLSVIYIIFAFLTLVVSSKYITGSVKALGTNVNIIILPLLLNLAMSYKAKIELVNNVKAILSFLSFLGIIAFLFAWAVNFDEILKVFFGTSAYKVDVSGFFYSKNIYGAFISLTIAADLYLLSLRKSFRKIVIIGAKYLAVVLSFSRAALLQAGIMTVVFLGVKYRNRIKDYIVPIVFVIICAGVLVLIKYNSWLYSFLYNSVFRFDVGDAGREVLRNQAVEKVEDNLLEFILGVGFAGIDTLGIDIDNTYLYVMFSGGVFKAIFYVIIMCFSLLRIIQIRHKNKELYRICLSVYISYLFFAFFESVAVLELGLLNFIFTFFLFVIPFTYDIGNRMAR